ncbi:MAG: hypothetical protein WA220_00445 [Candidatus Nitrosopolaris sp.]
MVVDLQERTNDGVCWTKDDISWLRDTVEYLRLEGFPKVAKMLEK